MQRHHKDTVATIVNCDTQIIKKSVLASVTYRYTSHRIITIKI